MELNYSILKITTQYSKNFEDSEGPHLMEVEIIGSSDNADEIPVGKAKVYLYNPEWIHFEITDGYEDDRTELFQSINFISYMNDEEPYFLDYHDNTVEINMNYGHIAIIDRISINEDVRGKGLGSKAFLDLLFFLKEKTGASWVLLKPYPLNWNGIETNETNESLFLSDLHRVYNFYKKFGMKFTYGKLEKPTMYLYLYESKLLDV